MYNLLVANNPEEWNGDPMILEIGRCVNVRERTDKNIAEKYGNLSLTQIEEIIEFPCIFAYETQCHKDPKFGFIREITKKQGLGKVKISYDLIHLDKFLTSSEFEEMHFELGIHPWEYNRTHWAIKDVDLQKELIAKGITLPKRDSKDGLMPINQHYEYDVALSFAGEDRGYADALAEELRHRGLRVFYDTYEKPTLWGKNLYSYLSDVYQNKARYCVMFLSKHYVAKLWTNHEREAAQARAFEENEEYILPIRLDNTKIPGIPTTIAYLSWSHETPKTIADAVVEKLGKKPLSTQEIIDRIGAITDKMVLILGRFTPERKVVLNAIRDALPSYNYTPILLDFDLPEGRSLTDVITMFAQMSRFIIADLTAPSNVPYELASIVPHYIVPIQPIMENRLNNPFSLFRDLQNYHWVLPIYSYEDKESLIASLKEHVIDPPEQKTRELAVEKAKRLKRL